MISYDLSRLLLPHVRQVRHIKNMLDSELLDHSYVTSVTLEPATAVHRKLEIVPRGGVLYRVWLSSESGKNHYLVDQCEWFLRVEKDVCHLHKCRVDSSLTEQMRVLPPQRR